MQDLIILGGGPAGYLAAERAAHRGMKVTLFEMRELGGVCLNEGCIPSKARCSTRPRCTSTPRTDASSAC